MRTPFHSPWPEPGLTKETARALSEPESNEGEFASALRRTEQAEVPGRRFFPPFFSLLERKGSGYGAEGPIYDIRIIVFQNNTLNTMIIR